LETTNSKWPYWGWIGILLVIVFWVLNWTLPGLHTHWGFFPMWVGYSLVVDALVYRRKGNSLLSRSWKGYLSLFLVSAPAWWLFELINDRTQYWHYTGRDHFSDLEYYWWASLDFSTVIPAVFGSAELFSTFRWTRNLNPKSPIGGSSKSRLVFFLLGWVMLSAVLIWPQYGAALMWISIYFILDPVNVWLGNRSLLEYTAKKNWQPIWSLWAGCLLCGFFWEMWNYYSNPKWLYSVPYVDFWYLFLRSWE